MSDEFDEFDNDTDEADEEKRRKAVALTMDLSVPISDAMYENLERMSIQYEMSIDALAGLAIANMILEDHRGEFTVVPEFQKWEPIHEA